MFKDRAVDAIAGILRAASYDVEDGNDTIDLTAYKGDDCIVAMCSDNAEKIESFNRTKFKVQTESGSVLCKKILFTMLKNPVCENCIHWGHMELAKYSGQATVADVLGEELVLDFETQEAGQKNSQISFENTLPQNNIQENLTKISCLPSQMNDDEAKLIAGIRGEIKHVFIPHYMYKCSSTGEKRFKSHIIDFNYEDTGLLSAISGEKTETDPEELKNKKPEERGIPAGSQIIQPKLKKSDLKDKLKDNLFESLKKSVRISKSEGDTIFYEDIEVGPDKENISIEMELVYLPVIQIRGDKIVEVDGFSGEILREPMDDGVELL
ncbi:hypothetical protein F1737_00420 [Methanoplanus sp. FWC-SCC4]|uniref:Uncharacterized protein n=1 Tax=Methanochimaera problematica TaxID=2609417 RepID=A0AA97FA86_9EURY|nr:hypothetical protein [Methanoplanus sp. FWC-SCC4]WOF15249.1 hypothetical protein F1737_00420 [Methanoplanus sp. FWC-SCC4]